MKVRLVVLAALLLLSTSLTGPVSAQTPIIDFNSFQGGGVISYAGGPTDPLIGTGIAINTVIGISTPSGVGSHAVVRGVLDFTSGPFTGFAGSIYSFGAGGLGSFTISGGVPDAGIDDSVLLSGRIGSVTVDTTSNLVYLLTVDGVDTKHPRLVSFFGVDSTLFRFGPAVLHMLPSSQTCDPPCAFDGPALDADIPNTGASTPAQAIPTLSEWGMIALLALLVGVALWSLRRQAPPARPA